MEGSRRDADRYERAIAELHDVAIDFATIDSRAGICQRTIDAAENLLEFDLSLVALEADGVLWPEAVSSDLSPDQFDAMSIDEGIAGLTYRTGESYLIDDLTAHDAAKPQGEWHALVSLPLGKHGNFQAVDARRGAFDEQDLKLAELLTIHATTHLDRIEKNRQLERQNDRLEEFAQLLSHDLRNPLRVASLRLDLLREECDSEHLDSIEGAHERMGALIDDVLTLAREGQTAIVPESVDLAALATDAWQTLPASNSRLVTDADRSILADEDSLKRLFENLFRNAIEHNDTGVTVTVGDLSDGFYIADDGAGILPDERARVFDAGYSTSPEGTGLGLRIVERVVEHHDWQIEIADGSDGGARFEITGVEYADG